MGDTNLVPCVGCGVLAAEHPIVAVMQPRDVPEGVPTSIEGPRGFVAVGCCNECYVHPEHRVRVLKAHFFNAADAAAAIFHAGSNSAVGGV